MEGELNGCLGAKCPSSCCQYGTMEPLRAFEISPRACLEDSLKAAGVNIREAAGFVHYAGCSDGTKCKLLNLSAAEGNDIRPLLCKIFPYQMYMLKEHPPTVGITLSDSCPVTNFGTMVPESFTEEVIRLIKSYYLDIASKEVEVQVLNGQFPPHVK